MRKIADTADEKTAMRLVNYLNSQGILAESRPVDDGGGVWILNEDHLRRARAITTDFNANPDDERFNVSTFRARPAVAEVKEIDVRTEVFNRPNTSAYGKLTMLLILVCTALHLVTADTPTGTIRLALYFSQYVGLGIPEIMSGQVWRLVTPILLHGDFFHLLFNMMWLYQLGNQVEGIKGTTYFALMMVALAVLCNSAQFLMSGPAFLGLSGVVYGLLGYIWMHTRYGVGSRFQLSQETVIFMVVWLVICLVGIIPGVANTQHVVGFVSGTLAGFISSGGLKIWWRKRAYKRRKI